MQAPDDDRHPLTEHDIASFFQAANKPPKRHAGLQPIDVPSLLEYLTLRHPLRIRRLRRDLYWLRKRGQKFSIEVF